MRIRASWLDSLEPDDSAWFPFSPRAAIRGEGGQDGRVIIERQSACVAYVEDKKRWVRGIVADSGDDWYKVLENPGKKGKHQMNTVPHGNVVDLRPGSVVHPKMMDGSMSGVVKRCVLDGGSGGCILGCREDEDWLCSESHAVEIEVWAVRTRDAAVRAAALEEKEVEGDEEGDGDTVVLLGSVGWACPNCCRSAWLSALVPFPSNRRVCRRA